MIPSALTSSPRDRAQSEECLLIRSNEVKLRTIIINQERIMLRFNDVGALIVGCTIVLLVGMYFFS